MPSKVDLPLHFPFPAVPPSVLTRRLADTSRGVLHRGLRLPDEPGQYPGCRHRRLKVLGAIPKCASRSARRHRLDSYALERMDFSGRTAPRPRPEDEAERRRRFSGTFQFDRIGGKLIDEMGVEAGPDYPHADGVWPSREVLSGSSSAI
jgi:hypothetical protein